VSVDIEPRDDSRPAAPPAQPQRRVSLAEVARLSRGPIGLALAVAIVTVQVVVNYRTGLISDLRSLYRGHRLYRDPVPYLDVRIEYPVMIGLFMTGAAAVTHGVMEYLRVSSVALWACAVGTVCALWGASRRSAWYFALSPLLLVFSLLNWDLLAILLMAAGWLAWTRDRYAIAAACLTLGVFTKLYPIFLLVFCFAALVRRRADGAADDRDLIRFTGVAVLTAAVVNVPFIVLAFHNWAYFWTFNGGRTEHADLLSWLGLLQHHPASTANAVLALVTVTAGAAGLVAVWRRAPPAHVAAVVFFVYMLFQKINSPQYTLWLVAFAALDEWDPWTIVALSMAGLADYANAAIHIELVRDHSNLSYWYVQHFYGNDQALRLITTLVTVIATVARRDLGWPRTGGPTIDPAS
jgi:uncharacterized membrane protein